MTEFKGDKRTKEYKQWKKNHEEASNGLGDTVENHQTCLLYTSPSPRDRTRSRMPSSA